MEKRKKKGKRRESRKNTVVSLSLLGELGGVDVLFSLISHLKHSKKI